PLNSQREVDSSEALAPPQAGEHILAEEFRTSAASFAVQRPCLAANDRRAGSIGFFHARNRDFDQPRSKPCEDIQCVARNPLDLRFDIFKKEIGRYADPQMGHLSIWAFRVTRVVCFCPWIAGIV